jgi:transposase
MRTAMDLLLLVVALLCQRLVLNKNNSIIPPSSDQNRNKNKNVKGNSTKKLGGQRDIKGHKGTTLSLDGSPGITHKLVVDIEFNRVVTEYCTQILENELGQHFVAPFPQDYIGVFNMVMG